MRKAPPLGVRRCGLAAALVEAAGAAAQRAGRGLPWRAQPA